MSKSKIIRICDIMKDIKKVVLSINNEKYNRNIEVTKYSNGFAVVEHNRIFISYSQDEEDANEWFTKSLGIPRGIYEITVYTTDSHKNVRSYSFEFEKEY